LRSALKKYELGMNTNEFSIFYHKKRNYFSKWAWDAVTEKQLKISGKKTGFVTTKN
jgi:hypothetical protein